MRKILSVMLIFVLAVTFVGLTNDVKAAEGDATVYFHIHQFDADYTSTGIGIWDGIDWNGWGATVSSTDDFGGVVEFVIPASKLADGNLMDDIQLEITRSADASDDAVSQAGLLAPGDGKVFADITSLKNGDATELHVYYVEGAVDTYIPAANMGMIFVTYADPTVAADEAAYDDWSVWTWNNGTNGSSAGPGDDEGFPFTMDMVVPEMYNGVTYEMAMKLIVLEVAVDADQNTGFIVRTDDWAKQCGSDIMIDNTDVRGSGTMVKYYQAGACEFDTNGPEYIAGLAEQYDYYSGNKFVGGTEIVDPNTVEVEFSMFKNPALLDLSRFSLKDAEGNAVPLVGVDINSMADLGSFTSDTMCGYDEYHMILYVDTTLNHDYLGIVGSLNGWDIGATVAPIGDDDMGNAVFEVCSPVAAGEFKLLYDEDGTFEWGGNTIEITPANQMFDMDNDAMAGVFYINVEDTMAEDIAITVDLTPVIENYVKVYVDTTNDHDYVHVVGSFNGWDIGGSTDVTEDDENGYAVFEFVTASDSVSFKVMYDDEEDGTKEWDPNDVALTPSNVDLDLSNGTEFSVFVDSSGAAMIVPAVGNALPTDLANFTHTTATTCAVDENLLTIVVSYDGTLTQLGLVGDLNGWNIDGTIAPIATDGDKAFFEVCLADDATGGYKVVVDLEDDGFNWDSSNQITPENVGYDVSGGDVVHYVEGYATLGAITETLEPTETIKRLVRIYVDSDYDYTKLGVVGNINNWDIDNVLMATGEDANGYAYFELVSVVDELDFKVLYDEDGTFEWADPTVEVTPANQIFEIGGDNEIALMVRGENAEELNMDLGIFNANAMSLDVNMVTLEVDSSTELEWGTEYELMYDEMILPFFDLFISEYIEGSSNNKAIEIYNPTGMDVDLTPYMLTENYGDAEAKNEFDLTGTLAAGEVFVICADAVDPASTLYTECDVLLAYPSVVHFNGDDTLQLYKGDMLIDQFGIEANAGGDDYAQNQTWVRNADVTVGTVHFDEDEWTIYDENMFDYAGAHTMTMPEKEMIASGVLPFNTTNLFVDAAPIEEFGTFAVLPNLIMVQFENSTELLDNLVLKDSTGATVPMESYENMYMPGLYDNVQTFCPSGEEHIFIHLKLTDTMVTNKNQLGVVGTINGWDIGNAITARGQDSEGNWVFEVCIPEETESGEFKVKLDPELNGFTWDSGNDPELTPGNVAFTVADGPHFFVEENESVLNLSDTHKIMLSAVNELDKTMEYHLEFIDGNGFLITIPVDMDTEAPVVTATKVAGTDFVFDNSGDFDLMDYYTILGFIDNRDGEMEYDVVHGLNETLIGEQTVTIAATDRWDNTTEYDITITVVDTTPPTITGDTTLTVTAGDEEPNWASYVTVTGGTLTINDSQVDMDEEGTFFVIFTAQDESNNKVTHTLEVTVEAGEAPNTGCFSSVGVASSIFVVLSVLGGAVLFFVRKP